MLDDFSKWTWQCKHRKSFIFSLIDEQFSKETLGHTEDALSENLNNFYFVSAHIISDSPQGKYKVTEERFTSLCYAGHLPGYTQNYNHHGLCFSINTLSARKLYSGKTRKYLEAPVLSVKQIQAFIHNFSAPLHNKSFAVGRKLRASSKNLKRHWRWSCRWMFHQHDVLEVNELCNKT